VTTPLIFIFSPLATERELAERVVVVCAKAMDEKATREIAIIREENILNFGITINSLLILKVKARTIAGQGRLTSDELLPADVVRLVNKVIRDFLALSQN
jgi:hypothetical protein